MEALWKRHYRQGATEIPFRREELEEIAAELKIEEHKNLGAVLYDYRFRKQLPTLIRNTAPKGKEWWIKLAGKSLYKFWLGPPTRIVPRTDKEAIKIPEATPEIVEKYRLDDEQAVLAKVRYNRLIDIFLSVTSYSLQSHLRTSTKATGQIEIDELYVAVNKAGQHFVIPVQAKGGSDQLSKAQTEQDIEYCKDKFPNMICRPISAQFIGEVDDRLIAMFELAPEGDDIKIRSEEHYRLVSASEISDDELNRYRHRAIP